VLSTLHTGLRVQRAPGIPHALCFSGREIKANLGRIAPRGRERAFKRHCEGQSDEAIHTFFLLRPWIASLRSQ